VGSIHINIIVETTSDLVPGYPDPVAGGFWRCLIPHISPHQYERNFEPANMVDSVPDYCTVRERHTPPPVKIMN
jgi:hypothetical protein